MLRRIRQNLTLEHQRYLMIILLLMLLGVTGFALGCMTVTINAKSQAEVDGGGKAKTELIVTDGNPLGERNASSAATAGKDMAGGGSTYGVSKSQLADVTKVAIGTAAGAYSAAKISGGNPVATLAGAGLGGIGGAMIGDGKTSETGKGEE